jgi:hypothetical protein
MNKWIPGIIVIFGIFVYIFIILLGTKHFEDKKASELASATNYIVSTKLFTNIELKSGGYNVICDGGESYVFTASDLQLHYVRGIVCYDSSQHSYILRTLNL